MLSGLLLVDKPEGPTSHDVVHRVRRLLGIKRVGHAGTLDPMATGLLLVLLGRGTRLAEYISSDDKVYEGTIKLGVSTDTADRLGNALREEPCEADLTSLDTVAARFVGPLSQRPPMYSAVSVGGKRLHKLARAGIEVDRPARAIQIHSLDLWVIEQSSQPLVGFKVACSKGTYVRVLAEDIGKALGCPAHLASLRRLSSGSWSVDQAVSLDLLEGEGAAAVSGRLVSMSDMLPGLTALTLEAGDLEAVRNGRAVVIHETSDTSFAAGDKVKLIDAGGDLVAVATVAPGAETGERSVKPVKVFV